MIPGSGPAAGEGQGEGRGGGGTCQTLWARRGAALPLLHAHGVGAVALKQLLPRRLEPLAVVLARQLPGRREG